MPGAIEPRSSRIFAVAQPQGDARLRMLLAAASVTVAGIAAWRRCSIRAITEVRLAMCYRKLAAIALSPLLAAEIAGVD